MDLIDARQINETSVQWHGAPCTVCSFNVNDLSRGGFARQEAEDMLKARSEFLAGMSHEIRTPLNAILGFSEVIEHQLLGNIGVPKYLEYARDIHRSGLDLLEIIGDILELARIESGRQGIKPVRVELPELFQAALRTVTPQARRKGLAITTDLPASGSLAIKVDERLTRVAIEHLLTNAVKYTPRGSVTLAAQISKEGLSISVRDTGVGMTGEERKVALKAFGQVEKAAGETERGSGLGLPLVKAFIGAMDGSFDLDSKPGEGTVATLHFPPACLIHSPEALSA